MSERFNLSTRFQSDRSFGQRGPDCALRPGDSSANTRMFHRVTFPLSATFACVTLLTLATGKLPSAQYWLPALRKVSPKCPPSTAPTRSAASSAPRRSWTRTRRTCRASCRSKSCAPSKTRRSWRCLELQKQVGIDMYSDGEFRRAGWSSDFAEAWRRLRPGRARRRCSTSGAARGPVRRPRRRPVRTGAPGGRVIGDKLVPKRRMTEHETTFLKAHAPGPCKMTMPAASYIVARGYNPSVTDQVYGSRATCSTTWPRSSAARSRRWSPRAARTSSSTTRTTRTTSSMTDASSGAPSASTRTRRCARTSRPTTPASTGSTADDVTVGMHLCRGNGGRGGWHTEGGYDRIAETVFGGLDVDRCCWSTTASAPAASSRCASCPRARTWCWAWSRPSPASWSRRTLIERRIDEAAKYVAAREPRAEPAVRLRLVMAGNPLSWTSRGASWSWWSARRARSGATSSARRNI